jgi:hypothetical protein
MWDAMASPIPVTLSASSLLFTAWVHRRRCFTAFMYAAGEVRQKCSSTSCALQPQGVRLTSFFGLFEPVMYSSHLPQNLH